ncbi:unnamed protein product [Colias eurytheme]|nr:unnamed protein product [Colias eurytheme]
MVTEKCRSEKTKRIYQMFIISAVISNVTTLDIIPDIIPDTITDIIHDIIPDKTSDTKLSSPEMAAKFGHPSEEHNVTTDDGYILALHHLPGKGMPILLMHGVADTSETWLIRGNTSLGITLAEMGHDIWIGDCRGNKYSRRHPSGYITCAYGFVFPGAGYDASEYESSFHYKIFQTYPASTPLKGLYHFSQCMTKTDLATLQLERGHGMPRMP